MSESERIAVGKGVSIEGMAAEIMEGLIKYKDLATEDMKSAVRKAGDRV